MRLMSLQQRKQPLLHIVHKVRNLIFEDEYPGEENHDHIEDKFQRYLKKAEINYRKDDPMDW